MIATSRPKFILAILLVVASTSSLSADDSNDVRVFDGDKCLLIVHGYSTSHHWWAFLQRKIDRYNGSSLDRVVEVRPCIKGGTPIARWMNVDSGERSEAWKQLLTPIIQSEKNKREVIVLAQQSLQFAYPGDRSAGIRSLDDHQRITFGADVIERYAKLILQDGAAAVIVGMHIFKHSMEPEIGNERFALAELVKRQPERIFAGPDTWEPTKKHFPLAFDTDKLHPNYIGAEIMAHYWFDALLTREGLDTPTWSLQEMENAIQNQPMGTTRDHATFTQKLNEWKIAEPANPFSGVGQKSRVVPQAILNRYDTDRDGNLNEQEREIFEKARARRRRD